MEKKIIRLVLLGTVENKISIKKIEKVKSDIFQISEIIRKEDLPAPQHPMFYMEKQYLDNQLRSIIPQDKNEIITICLIDYALENNFYIRRLRKKTAVLSIKNPYNILKDTSISINNYVIRNIYEIITLAIEVEDLTDLEISNIPHIQTKGCLFDMNGELSDIIHNTEKPIICKECKSRLTKRNLPDKYLQILEKELKKIRKGFIPSLEAIIKHKPLIAMLISAIFGFLLNQGMLYLIDAKNINKEDEANQSIANDQESTNVSEQKEVNYELYKYEISFDNPCSIFEGEIIITAMSYFDDVKIEMIGTQGLDKNKDGDFDTESIIVSKGSRFYFKDLRDNIWVSNVLATSIGMNLELFDIRKLNK